MAEAEAIPGQPYKVGKEGPKPPESTPLDIKPVLVFVPDFNDDWRMGWFIGGLVRQWRMDGSPSDVHPTHWSPLPPVPKTRKRPRRR